MSTRALRGFGSTLVLFLVPLIAQANEPIARYRLSSGLAVVLMEVPEASEAVVLMRCESGASEDARGASGAAHLVEHLSFFPGASLDGAAGLEARGSRSNAHTTQDAVTWVHRGPPAVLERLLAIEAERSRAHALDGAMSALDAEKRVIRTEFAEAMSQRSTRVWMALSALLYGPKHPYARPEVGLPPELDRLEPSDLMRRGAEVRDPSRCAVGVAGPAPTKQVRAYVERLFGDLVWPTRPHALIDDRSEPVKWVFDSTLETATGQDALWLAWPTGRKGHPESAVAEVTARVLENRLRARGMSAHAGARSRALAGELWLRFEGEAWTKRKALRETQRAIRWLTGGFVESSEVRVAIEGAIADHLRGRSDLAARLESEVECARVRGAGACVDLERARFTAVTVDDVIGLAKTRLVRKSTRTLTVQRVGALSSPHGASTPALAPASPAQEDDESLPGAAPSWEKLPISVVPTEGLAGWRIASVGEGLTWLELALVGGVPEGSNAALTAALKHALLQDTRWDALRAQGVEVKVSVTALDLRLTASTPASQAAHTARVLQEVLVSPTELDARIAEVQARALKLPGALPMRLERALLVAEFGAMDSRLGPAPPEAFTALSREHVVAELDARKRNGRPSVLYAGEGRLPWEALPTEWGTGVHREPAGPVQAAPILEQHVQAGVGTAAVWLLVSGDASGAIAEPAADVLLEVLAGGAESSFAQALRREGVAVHTLRLGVKRWPEAARYRVLVRCPPEDTVRVRRVLADEIARVRVDGVSAAELSRAKGSAFHDLAAEWSTTEGVFDAIARLRVRSSPPNDVVRTAQERAALTPEGVNDVVPALLAPERLSWVEVSPVKNSGATP